jgi:hypothetical protein
LSLGSSLSGKLAASRFGTFATQSAEERKTFAHIEIFSELSRANRDPLGYPFYWFSMPPRFHTAQTQEADVNHTTVGVATPVRTAAPTPLPPAPEFLIPSN